MRSTDILFAAVSLALPAVTAGQVPVPASPTDERRLSPAQVEAVLAEAATKREAAAKPRQPASDPDDAPAAPQIHGEVGLGIGTGGYREAYGTAVAALGNGSAAAISFDFLDLGDRHFPR